METLMSGIVTPPCVWVGGGGGGYKTCAKIPGGHMMIIYE